MAGTLLFDRYRLIEALGSGTSAEVWRALDERTGEDVALKRLHPLVFADEAGRRRLAREFRALRSVTDPHVVRVRDLEFARDDAAIILDYVAGPSLATRLAGGLPVAVDEAVRIGVGIASALEAAHAVGIIHRDVKPGNILLGPDGMARLTDFGIAHDGADETAMTGAGLLVGTFRYMAPEQLRGAPATPASDQYALAAVLYEMLAGRPPYVATTPVGLAEEQTNPPPPIDGAPAALDGVVRRGLATDPERRYPSVEGFASALAVVLDSALTEIAGVPIAAVRAGAVAAATPAVAAVSPAAARPKRAAVAGGRTRVLAPVAGLVALAFGALVVIGTGSSGPGQAGVRATPTVATSPRATLKPSAAPAKAAPTDEDGSPGKGDGRGKGKGKDDD